MKEGYQFGILHCKGEDAGTFLQGQLSANINTLTDTQGTLACYLNLKGRVVALMCVIKHPDGFWLVMPRDMIETLMHKLKKFIVFSKATMTDISDQYRVEGVFNPPADINNVVFDLSPGLGLLIAPGSPADISPEFIKAMFEAGIPWIGHEQSEKFLPHYINLVNLNAIAFDKGCFVGQEVVARMHYRGHLDKTLVLLDGTVSPDDEIVNCLEIDDHTYQLVSRKC
jgi:folate-binding protein YgfZ